MGFVARCLAFSLSSRSFSSRGFFIIKANASFLTAGTAGFFEVDVAVTLVDEPAVLEAGRDEPIMPGRVTLDDGTGGGAMEVAGRGRRLLMVEDPTAGGSAGVLDGSPV